MISLRNFTRADAAALVQHKTGSSAEEAEKLIEE